MTEDDIERVAEDIGRARRARRTLDAEAFTREHGGPSTLSDAYRVQRSTMRRRLESGERQIGWKLGYTSEAMRAQMGIDQPNFGALTDAMLVADGGTVPESVIQPRVEPEIAVRIGRDITAPTSIELVGQAVEETLACLEVVDSVWSGYRFRVEHNTADGSSAAHVVLGASVTSFDLAAISVELRRNGESVARATGSAASGHPLAGVVWLAGRLAQTGDRLHAGDIVITGGLTAAVPLEPGDHVEAVFDHDRTVSVRRS